MKLESAEPTLSVVIPTVGRETLRDTLQSVLLQEKGPQDEVIVVGDGEQRPWVRALVEGLGFRYLVHGPTRDWGNSQRNFGYHVCHGSHVVHMDDDDIFAEDAFIKIRKEAQKFPSSPLMFKMVSVPGEVVWTERAFERGNTGTPMAVIPNDRPRLLRCKWPPRQGGDIKFFEQVSETLGPFIWLDEVICICRPLVKWWS